MDITNRCLSFIDREVELRREQREYLSGDGDGNVRGRGLFIRLSDEIVVLEYLRGLIALSDNRLILSNKNKNMSKFKPLADRI